MGVYAINTPFTPKKGSLKFALLEFALTPPPPTHPRTHTRPDLKAWEEPFCHCVHSDGG